ncbi:MAG: 4Fe-4S cluster-binding domain-containing protein [Treponema sp.]|nr:4Fe-4S cluster-binding domain-containing protein [Treponema sp.]
MLKTGTLYHGGIMVNYQCNASCRHCLYACSPARNSGYVNEETAEEICRLLQEGGCKSVHIGGGEPFLNFDGLLMMVRALNKSGIALDYIETNAFWAEDLANTKPALEKLKRLLAENADTLCISLDPFHAEYVPYGAALNLAKLCEKNGMRYFLWKQEFFSVLSRLDSQKTHSRQDMEKTLSTDYINKTVQHYGITYGGRAVNIEKEYKTLFPAENFAGDNSPCSNLLLTGHFHVDKDCNFIPPGCTGILIPLSEALRGINEDKYPVFASLYHGGISSLLEFVVQHGFSPDNAGYPSKCNLCFFIRKFLSEKDFAELDKNHYTEALKYYT